MFIRFYFPFNMFFNCTFLCYKKENNKYYFNFGISKKYLLLT